MHWRGERKRSWEKKRNPRGNLGRDEGKMERRKNQNLSWMYNEENFDFPTVSITINIQNLYLWALLYSRCSLSLSASFFSPQLNIFPFGAFLLFPLLRFLPFLLAFAAIKHFLLGNEQFSIYSVLLLVRELRGELCAMFGREKSITARSGFSLKMIQDWSWNDT